MSSGLRGQAKVIDVIRRRVDAWRGSELGRASEPFPSAAPRYEPIAEGEQAASPTTLALLHHWFRREPHSLGRAPHVSDFKYWPHQRRTVETFIYLYEVCGIRRTQELYALAGVDPLADQRDPWAKLGAQLATGSGKTKVMSLLITWAYLNAVCEPDSKLGFGRHSILIAPGLFVRDRLLQDFLPEHGGTPVFWADPVVPPEFETLWNLKVYSPTTCPLELDPAEGALVVTNYHQLLRSSEAVDLSKLTPEERQIELLFQAGEPSRLEETSSPLIERFAESKGLLVLNDEAHHVWDETGHAKFQQRAKAKDPDAQVSMAWIRSIRNLNGSSSHEGRVAAQIDLSATLFEEAGARRTASKQAGRSKVAFKQPTWFRHTSVHYGLAEAIQDGIVKRPILERVVVRNKKTGDPEPLIRDGSPNAWEKYRNLLHAGIERWKRVKEQLEEEGDPRKPILFIIANTQREAREVANYLRHQQAVSEDMSHLPPTGFPDNETGEQLFLAEDSEGNPVSTVVEIHIGKKENASEAAWEQVRQAVNAVDRDEIPDPSGAKDDYGQPILIPNPYNVVVSVMMLKEGWDVRNVKVIVPLRPCDSRTLTEQTLGRGLRKMHPPVLDEEGGAFLKSEELFVIEHPSFKAILDQIQDIIEEKDSDEIEHAREYVPIRQKDDDREPTPEDVRLVRFEGLKPTPTDWRGAVKIDEVPAVSPRIPWQEELDETEIQTFLKEALKAGEQEGHTFDLPQTPSYRDFDHVIELGYAIPLLRDLKASFQYKVAVKGIVREFLERKTFNLPAGVPLSFDNVIAHGHGLIALGNLARPDVIERVRARLLPALQEAMSAERAAMRADLWERSALDISDYQAIKANVFEEPENTTFDRAALENPDELRAAVLLDRAKDVVSWLSNHRSGVGFLIEYPWQGYIARYFPDFIARARIGNVFHNFIIEVKGRFDDRDKKKAEYGRSYCALLTEHDREPWHYLMLLENRAAKRLDITWWEQQSAFYLDHVRRRHEKLPLYPDRPDAAPPRLEVIGDVPAREQHRDAVQVFDLAAAAGTFSDTQTPEPMGWMRIATHRPIDKRLFVAKVSGKSMEPAIPDGCWGLFRFFPHGSEPAAFALDGRRVVVQLREFDDPETGGTYTLKRWRVSKTRADGTIEEVELAPDNPKFEARILSARDDDVRVVAEFLEVVG